MATVSITPNCSPDQRVLFLGNEVTGGTVESIIKDIIKFNEEDDEKQATVVDYKRKPIKLVIKSYGGSVYDGFALIGAIEMSETEVHGLVLGPCMSMGFAIPLS